MMHPWRKIQAWTGVSSIKCDMLRTLAIVEFTLYALRHIRGVHQMLLSRERALRDMRRANEMLLLTEQHGHKESECLCDIICWRSW